jgi:hypothetical protein
VPTTTDGRVEVVTVSLADETTTLIVADAVWVGLLLSCADTVKLDVPMVEGTPEMVPVDERVSPDGRLPDVTVQV